MDFEVNITEKKGIVKADNKPLGIFINGKIEIPNKKGSFKYSKDYKNLLKSKVLAAANKEGLLKESKKGLEKVSIPKAEYNAKVQSAAAGTEVSAATASRILASSSVFDPSLLGGVAGWVER